jgi:hypothetical protein
VRSLIVLLIFGLGLDLQAQMSFRDTSVAMVLTTATYAYQIPSGDLSTRFGTNHNVGLSALRKSSSNYLYGLEGSFIFGNNVNEVGLLRGLINSQGQIVDAEGQMADVQIFERGYTVMAVAGKLIPVAGPNPNSGILLKLGAGYMRHKIRLQTQKNDVPQLQDEYVEGYDRLAAGPAGLFFVGYQNLSNNRRINFTLGFELMLGFTEPLRAYNFDTRTSETDRRIDMLTGFRAGWTIPIYKRMDDRFHY